MPQGYLSILLHAHLPYVRHPEYPEYLEEGWLFEAISETYVPLLWAFERLRGRGVDYRIAMDFSPPLCEMLADELLIGRFRAQLDKLCRLADEELVRCRGGEHEEVAQLYRDHFHGVRWTLFDRLGGRLLPAYADLEATGHLEILTCTATHGFLPQLRTERGVRAQLAVACAAHEKHFGRRPRGIWLAECGYRPGVEAMLSDEGLTHFFLDGHGLLYGRPRPPFGVFSGCRTPAGPVAIARDPESSRQVWSRIGGFPGHADYREFYRDLGYDAPYDRIKPYLMGDGVRRSIGFKYHRITGKVDLGEKEPYEPRRARDQAERHAAEFLDSRRAQVRYLREAMGSLGGGGNVPVPMVLAPYDCELFGHWWFEGPHFLENLLDRTVRFQDEVALLTPEQYLERERELPVVEPAISSWGAGGYGEVWCNEKNDWMIPHVHHAEETMLRLAAANPTAGGLLRRALNQAARELLLAQSSDWAFIITMGTSPPYAHLRFRRHLEAFLKLAKQIETGAIDEKELADLENRHAIFPEIDYRVFA